VQRVHLVDAHPVEPLVLALEDVDEADGLAVGEGQDHVGAGPDVIEDVLLAAGGGTQSRHARLSSR
jgi:hypothetical protein